MFKRLPDELARMLRGDLKAARYAWIAAAKSPSEKKRREADRDFLAYQDSAGLFFDFHSCRHTFISAIVNSGASVKVAQELARHSSPMLTIGKYAHTRISDLRGALDALPAESGCSACAAVGMLFGARWGDCWQ